jgi:hypothetical protein
MPEIEEKENQTIESSQKLENGEVFGIPVVFSSEGKKVDLSKDEKGQRIIKINAARFKTTGEAKQAAYLEAATLDSMKRELSGSSGQFLELMKEKPNAAKAVMRLRAAAHIKIYEPDVAEESSKNTPAALTFPQQFDWLCGQYILTGKIPDEVSEEIKSAGARLSPDGTRNALDFIVQSNRSFKSAVELYERYVKPVADSIKNKEKESRKTERDDYVPPPFSGETEPLDPNAVRFKVRPFLGGYYRGQIFRYDPGEKRLVARESTKSTFNPQEIPENLDELKQYTFSGTYLPLHLLPTGEKENILPLPVRKDGSAFPLPATLKPPDLFTLMRSKAGVFSLEPKNGKKIDEPISFEFTFVMAKTFDNCIDDVPEEEDMKTIDGPLGEKFESFMEALVREKLLSHGDKAGATVSMIREALKYPKKEQREEMNVKYKAAGAGLLPTIEEHGIADCHWSNISACELNKRLGIPSRVPTGFFVQKHPDVDFAPVGGIGHAWSEIYDEKQAGTRDLWIKMDATPPQENEKDEEKSGGGQESKAEKPRAAEDIEEDDTEVEESGALSLTSEELEELREELTGIEPLQADIADELFKARTGVDSADWKAVKSFIDAVNKTQVPIAAQIPETPAFMQAFGDQIKAPKGTLEREWQKLFCLICKNRAIKRKAFRGPVRQSEGTRLRDPVEAYIDIRSGDPDPGGYELEATKKKTILDVREFDEDAIIDLTSSMNDTDEHGHVMRVEQKKAILALLYQVMRLNERLNDSRTVPKMREPVTINSTIYSIHGGKKNKGNYACLKSSDEQLTEQVMVHLARELDITTPGAGDLLSALKKYREGITGQLAEKLKSGKFVKLLTIYSDGNLWCSACGHESCNVEMHRENIVAIQKEVQALRAMGVIVQGIGFTQNARAIKAICEDAGDPESAVVVDDVSNSTLVRQKMLVKHLKKL